MFKIRTESKTLSKKAGIQLSISFLVMLIIAVVVFVLSLGFLKEFFGASQKMSLMLEEQAQIQIKNMLAGNSRVAVPIDRRVTKQGEPVIFGIGIKNTIPQELFRVRIEGGSFILGSNPDADPEKIVCASGTCRFISGPDTKIVYLLSANGNTEIKMNDDATITFQVMTTTDAPRGDYIFNLLVEKCTAKSGKLYTGCTSYDNAINKVHMIVK